MKPAFSDYFFSIATLELLTIAEGNKPDSVGTLKIGKYATFSMYHPLNSRSFAFIFNM